MGPLEAVQSLSSCEVEVPYIRLPHPRTGSDAFHESDAANEPFSDIPSLFLPIESSGDVDTSQILELQAINPFDSRSWFLENEVIAGA
jgi:ribonuclease H2 subunit B